MALEPFSNVRAIFDQFDTNNSGTVDTSELRNMCNTLRIGVSESSFKKIVCDADPENTGEISFRRFQGAMSRDLGRRFAQLKVVFDSFDIDRSGTVSTDELSQMCKRLKLEVTNEEINHIMTDADPDGVGEIDFGEFVAAVASQLTIGEGRLAELYERASVLLAEAETAGAAWTRKEQNPLVAAAKIANAERLARRAFPCAPTPGSLLQMDHDQPPVDATCYERCRDGLLSFFVMADRPFMILAIACVLSLAGFGVVFAPMLLSFLLDVNWFGVGNFYPECTNCTANIATYLAQHPDCNKTADELQCLEPTHKWVDEVNGQTMHPVCTTAQWWFNFCIKMFTFIMTYPNTLCIPWRVAILIHATLGRTEAQSDGVDFYGRPTEACQAAMEHIRGRRCCKPAAASPAAQTVSFPIHCAARVPTLTLYPLVLVRTGALVPSHS